MRQSPRTYDYIIVGSGAGGATLARELSREGHSTLIIERGHREDDVGTFGDAVRYYDTPNMLGIPRKSRQGVILWRTLMAGGSTMVTCANATPCLEPELKAAGIDLGEVYLDLEEDVSFGPIPEEMLSEGSQRIREAAGDLGYKFAMMPKFLDPQKCRRCGNCTLGCRFNAHWTALDFLHDARLYEAEVRYDTRIDNVIIEDGQATGVQGCDLSGPIEFRGETVILAAGGLGTPVILQKSGVEGAGEGLFVDIMVNSYGVTDGLNQIEEPQMALLNHDFKDEGFIIAPYVSHARRARFLEAGPRGMMLPTRRILGLMTVINDDPTGKVSVDGDVSKEPTWRDMEKLRRGTDVARDILLKAGANPDSIITTTPAGAHPGGTAAIGRVVDSDLQTEVPGLYVCDASVLPAAPGLPPTLTIMALAKRLSEHLIQ